MRPLQYLLTFFMVTIAYFDFATAYLPTTSLGLTTCLFGFVASFEHQVAAPADSHLQTKASMHDGCYGGNRGNQSLAKRFHPGLVSWTDLAKPRNQTNVAALNHTFEALCAGLASETFSFGQHSYHCLADNMTTSWGVYGEYSVIASMTYLGPDATFSMAGNYEYCLAAMARPRACPKGGFFGNVSLPWSDINGTGQINSTQYWDVRAQAVLSSCRTTKL
ncbi:hypothetical protein VPNG_05870 [Cytospora leucostoma]|uniref:Uncharacterized protein n=1 Tax=Cytospora leucostoma TaxID=1230097 RepID=A0A423X095_9PEZI|nr:hypothetical protein VPNG_05870 [Cytospora leucostoma]